MLSTCGWSIFKRLINKRTYMIDSENTIEQLIISYLSGTATRDEIARLTGWVNENPNHYRYYQQMRNIWQISHPAFCAKDIDTGKAHARLMHRMTSHKWYQSSYIQYWQYIAAVLLLPVLVLSAYLFMDRPDEQVDVVYHKIFAPYGTFSKVNLSDGSTVWLNAGSSLKFPVVFMGGKRNVFLSGEAFFEVESDKKNPFIVETQALRVRATGTSFNVEAYKKDSVVSVTMVKGQIDVTIGKAQPFSMNPGERLGYNTNDFCREIQKTDPYKWYAWKDGMLIFRDDPLDYVFKRIGQTFNIDIAVKDTSIASHLYRATFEDESLDEILRLLKLTAPIRYKEYARRKTTGQPYAKQRIEVYGEKSK